MLESHDRDAVSAASNCSEPHKDAITQSHLRYNIHCKYKFIRTLGKGTYGKVKLAVENGTGQKYAVKTIRKDRIKDKKDMTHIRREMTIMSSLHHPNIIQIHEVFENQDKIVIVMEYAPEGELYDYLADKKLTSEEESRVFFRQIVSAVEYCHNLGIVHRDLKLENILLGENYEIKIADFGLANLFKSDQLLDTFCGSPLYASPEIVNGVPYKGPEVDSWSLGVLLYALVYCVMPFDGSDNKTLTKQISNGAYSRQTEHPDAADLIDKMLTVDPYTRFDIHQIANHYWLQKTPSSTAEMPIQNSVQIMDQNSNYVHTPVEAAYPVTASTVQPIQQFPVIASSLSGCVAQSISPIPVPNGYIRSRQTANECLVKPISHGTVLTPCALENCENTTCPMNRRKGILKRFSAPAMSNVSFSTGLAPPHPATTPHHASPVRSNCLDGAMFVKDDSCGLQAKDSLKLKAKPLGASGKRRNLRTKKDRESGYYSSPERTPVDVQSAAPVFNFAPPVIKPQLTTTTQHGLHHQETILPPPQLGVPAFGYVVPMSGRPIPIIEGQTLSYYSGLPVRNPIEPATGSLSHSFAVAPLNDEGRSVVQRPISSYSDSSILSSDSFELCTFDSPLNSATLFNAVGFAPSNTVICATQPTNQLVLSAAVRPASLPVLVSPPPVDVGRSSPEPSGALTPNSAKLNHDLSQILLTPNRQRRRRAEQETLSGSQPAKLGKEQATQLEEMMQQLNLDLERACKQGLDMKVSLTASAEV